MDETRLEVADVRVLLPEILEALPYPEGEVLRALWFEGLSLRELMTELSLKHPWQVVRIERRAMARIRELVADG